MNIEEYLNDIRNSITSLIRDYRDLFSKEEYLAIKRVDLLIRKKAPTNYEELLAINGLLKPYFARAWQQDLTNFADFAVGDKFKFVITCPTMPVKDYDFNLKIILSASLITDKHMGTFSRINYGLVCQVDENNLLTASSRDAHSVVVLEGDCPGYIHTGTTKDGHEFYSKKYINGLKLPNQIEMATVKENIQQNGDFIKEINKNVYSDITLDAKETKFLGVILFEPYSSRDYEEALALKEKFNLNMKIIPKQLYYEKISVQQSKNDKHYYDIKDLDTIIYLLKHLNQIQNEFSNLIIERNYSFVNIKEESNLIKISINNDLNIASIYLPNDNRYFKIDYSAGFDYAQFSIDDEIVNYNEFKENLNTKENNKSL